MARHPEIGIRMAVSADPVDLAREGGIDVAIAYGTKPAQPGVIAEPLGTELVTALIAPALDAALDFSGPGLPEELTLIESAVSPVRWDEWLALNGLTAPRAVAAARPSFDRGADGDLGGGAGCRRGAGKHPPRVGGAGAAGVGRDGRW